MAINSVLTNEKLAIRVESGQDAQGKKLWYNPQKATM